MFDPTVAFTAEEINMIELAGLPIGPFRDWYALYPDQNIDTAIGGYVMHLQQLAAEAAPVVSGEAPAATPAE